MPFKVYPISVLNENLRSRSEYVNRQSGERDSRWVLTKRFFLFDRQTEATGAGELLRVPVHVSFHVHLQLSRDGSIFPPHLRIRHTEFHTAKNNGGGGNQSSTQATVSEEKVEVGFSMNYVIDSFRHDKTIEVLMATLCSCSVIWSAVRAYR
ncbi:Meckelin [Aphelenchoides avenae]|nr:Meckelin [Aphelenchus avenae]